MQVGINLELKGLIKQPVKLIEEVEWQYFVPACTNIGITVRLKELGYLTKLIRRANNDKISYKP